MDIIAMTLIIICVVSFGGAILAACCKDKESCDPEEKPQACCVCGNENAPVLLWGKAMCIDCTLDVAKAADQIKEQQEARKTTMFERVVGGIGWYGGCKK